MRSKTLKNLVKLLVLTFSFYLWKVQPEKFFIQYFFHFRLHLKYPSFGPACALAKRWLNSQLLDDFHFPSIIAELLVASSYTSPHPHSPAFNPQTVFLRFLALLSQTDWNTEPLVVNFNSEMPGLLTQFFIRLQQKFGFILNPMELM